MTITRQKPCTGDILYQLRLGLTLDEIARRMSLPEEAVRGILDETGVIR